jgi:hypothetical protein
MEAKRFASRILVGKPEGKRPTGKTGSRWEIIIKWMIERQARVIWTGFIWLWIGASGGLLWTQQ